MKDKAKLHYAAIFSGLVVIGVYLDNRHDKVIADHVLSICTYAIVAAVGGHVTLSGIQSWVGGAQEIIQKFDPKDILGMPE